MIQEFHSEADRVETSTTEEKNRRQSRNEATIKALTRPRYTLKYGKRNIETN